MCVAQASATKPPQRVGIVGGGPAGLALAHALLTLDSGAEEVKVRVPTLMFRSLRGLPNPVGPIAL